MRGPIDADNHYYEPLDAFTRHLDPVAAPGCLDLYLRGTMPEGVSRSTLIRSEPRPPEYRDRDLRIRRLDAQGLAGAPLFPTLGVGVEEALRDDVPATMASLHAVNRL